MINLDPIVQEILKLDWLLGRGLNHLDRVRKPKNRISRILPPGIVVCWSCLSISEATLKPNLSLLSLRINAFLLFA